MTMYSARYTLENPNTSDLPETEFDELNYVVAIAAITDESNFSSAKQYVTRLSIRMQALFLVLLVRSLPIGSPIKFSPEYATWFQNKELAAFLFGH